MKLLQTRIGEEQHKKLKIMAVDRGMTMQALMAEIIDNGFTKQSPIKAKPAKVKFRDTVIDPSDMPELAGYETDSHGVTRDRSICKHGGKEPKGCAGCGFPPYNDLQAKVIA